MPTFPGKNWESQKGFPSPDSLPDDSICRTFTIPNDPAWMEVFMGALFVLTHVYNWYNWGSIDPQDAADKFDAIIQQAYDDSFTATCGALVDTPFWDDTSGDDSDDEETPATQEWFGVWDGESFVEALSYWGVTAFLATGISEGAAIKFITPLRTFRLTLKKNPHGAKLLAMMDGNIFQLIDLYSAADEVTTVDIVSPGSTLMLVHSGEHNDSATPDENGNYLVQVIKSRLTDSDVLPPNIRYTTDTPPVFQTTPDGGTTWIDSPAADPRHNPAGLLPPLTPYSGIECDVAARMTAQLKATLDNFIASIDAAQFASAVLALIGLPFGWVGWLVDVALFVGNTLIDIGQANIESAFTSGIYDDIQCILSCYIDANGQISQSSLDVAYDQIEAAHPGTVADTIAELRFLYGDVAMSNAGVSRTETGDCSGCDPCDWILEYDFENGSTDGWKIYLNPPGANDGTYGGAYFLGIDVSGSVTLFIYFPCPGAQLTGAAFYSHIFHGTGIANIFALYDITSTADPPSFSLYGTSGLATVNPLAWEQVMNASHTVTDGIGFYMRCDSNGTGYIQIHKARLAGTGTPPPGGTRVNSLT